MQQRTRTLFEYAAKGVIFAWIAAAMLETSSLRQLGALVACVAVPLLVVCVIGIFALRRRSKNHGGVFALTVLTILDRPVSIYAAILGGLAAGLLATADSPLNRSAVIATFAVAGIVVGVGFGWIQRISRRWVRLAVAAVLAAIFAGAIWGVYWLEWLPPFTGGPIVAATLSFGLIVFYLAMFAGRAEETEVEVGALCLGGAGVLLQLGLPPMAQRSIIIIPFGLFIVYCERIRRGLIVFKHSLRGLGFEQQHRLRDALIAYRQALRIDPKSELAAAGSWRVHSRIDLTGADTDEDVLELIDPAICIVRAREVLAEEPTAEEKHAEIEKLLKLAEHHRPAWRLTIGRERLRSALLKNDVAGALEYVKSLTALSPHEAFQLHDDEATALYEIWKTVVQHPQLAGQGGLALLEDADRRFNFLAVVERYLKRDPKNDDARNFKIFGYEETRWEVFEKFAAEHDDDAMEWFDFRFCLKLADAATNDPANYESTRERIGELLQIAEAGLPDQRIEIWHRLAEYYESTDAEKAAQWRRRIKDAGVQQGAANLAGEAKEKFFASVRRLAQDADAAEDWPRAAENWELYSRSSKAGTTTLAHLQSLYEKIGDQLAAIRAVEAALAFSLASDDRKKWLGDKYRLYADVSPETVQRRAAEAKSFFDFGYCYRLADRFFEDEKPSELVRHFLDLAAMGGGEELVKVNYLLGRTYLRDGRFDDAVQCFEEVKKSRPDRFRDSLEEDAYFSTCRLLGDLYLDELNQPAEAVNNYSIYKEYIKSGADTLYRLATAYEADGRFANARKWYDMVLVYPKHPRAEAAQAALERLKAKS